MNRSGTAEIYFIVQSLTNAATPAIAGDGTFVLPATIGSLKIPLPTVDSGVRVLMISSGTLTYSITPDFS